jgi:hypothetical protein
VSGRRRNSVQTVLKKISVTLSLLASFSVYAGSTSDPDVYNFEGGKSLIDLVANPHGVTNMNACDDCVSNWSPTFPFTFTIWGEDYTRAKMSTNGCVNFTGLNCQDYTPQPLPYRDNTLYPFWTDLIRGESSTTNNMGNRYSSTMAYKGFDDYVVFGWYYMREYQRLSSNSFEVLLHKNNTYEYRYRELDIINHDVLIGEQNSSSDHKTYRFYDDNTGGHNTWDSYDASFGSSKLEGGGSLSSASFEDMCANNVLYNSSCTGYAAAYLAQQCGISALYDSSCTGYAAAYLAQQCGLSALYNTSCSGYAEAYFNQQCGINALYDTDCSGYAAANYTYQCTRDALYDSGCDGYWEEVAYQASLVAVTTVDTSGIDDTDMYGYDDDTAAQSLGYASEDEYYGYDYDDYDYDDGTDTDYYYDDDPYLYDDFTDQEWYEIDVAEFGQELVDEWYGTEVEFADDGAIVWEEDEFVYETDEEFLDEEMFWANIDSAMDAFDAETEFDLSEETFLWEEETFFEDEIELIDEPDYEDLEELEEIFLEELDYEEMELAQVLLDDVDVYILQEETGLELIREEDWTPEEELDLYEDVLEDFERDALEELEEEIYEEFTDEIDEDALEELIDEELEEEFTDEEDLEDEIEEEFFEEAEEKELEVEEKKVSRSSRIVARTKRAATTPTQIIAASNSSSSTTTVASTSSGVSTSQVMQEQSSGQQQSNGQQQGQQQAQQQQSQGGGSTYSGPSNEGQVQVTEQITQEIAINESTNTNRSTNSSTSSGNVNNSNSTTDISSSGVINNETQDFSGNSSFATVGTNNFDSIGQVSSVFIEPMAEVEIEEISIDTGFADVSVEFEQTFNDALGAGQSIGQFLSNTAPNFSRFNVEPPTIEQSNTIAAVENLADRVGTEQAQANLEAQFETMEETGGFGDQTVAVAFIGYAPGFSAYTDQAQLTDREFYRDVGLPSPDVVDNNFSFYMMAGNADKKIAAMRR